MHCDNCHRSISGENDKSVTALCEDPIEYHTFCIRCGMMVFGKDTVLDLMIDGGEREITAKVNQHTTETYEVTINFNVVTDLIPF